MRRNLPAKFKPAAPFNKHKKKKIVSKKPFDPGVGIDDDRLGISGGGPKVGSCKGSLTQQVFPISWQVDMLL